MIRLNELSQKYFGVKTLTHLIDQDDGVCRGYHEEAVAFFGEDKHSLVLWGKSKSGYFTFHAQPEHAQTVKRLRKLLGDDLVWGLTADRDFGDICSAFEAIRESKKQVKKLVELIEAVKVNFAMVPKAVSIAVHDHLLGVLKRAEKANKPIKHEAPLLPPVSIVARLSKLTLPEDLEVTVCTEARELRALGKAQGHCVGTSAMGYIERARIGQIAILSVKPKGAALCEGLTVELDSDGDIIQVQGRGRRSPSRKSEVAFLEAWVG